MKAVSDTKDLMESWDSLSETITLREIGLSEVNMPECFFASGVKTGDF
jgi:hypothetical protein